MEKLLDNRQRNIWDLNVPRVVKLFLWKVGNDLLAAKNNPFYKKIVDNPYCPICLKGEESLMHVLGQCLATNDVWAEDPSIVQKWNSAEDYFLDLYEKMVGKISKAQLEEIAVEMRRVWLGRNEFIFQNRLCDLNKVIKPAQEGLEEFQLTQKS